MAADDLLVALAVLPNAKKSRQNLTCIVADDDDVGEREIERGGERRLRREKATQYEYE